MRVMSSFFREERTKISARYYEIFEKRVK